MRTAMHALLIASLVLLGLRVLPPAPLPSDPPEMHAFYHAWLQPPWWLIVLPFALAVLLPFFRHVVQVLRAVLR